LSVRENRIARSKKAIVRYYVTIFNDKNKTGSFKFLTTYFPEKRENALNYTIIIIIKYCTCFFQTKLNFVIVKM